MTAFATTETVSDYARYDFRALWVGREKVTEVERWILTNALRDGDCRRVLEVGTGFGRLLGALTNLSPEVVATDFDAEGLARVPVLEGAAGPFRIAANVYHLPFGDGAFTAATMVRVYHHLAEPGRALREIARVLRDGGRALVSYNPKPSVGTLVNDVQRALHPSRGVGFRSITFAAGPTALEPDPFPVYVAGRREFRSSVAAAGFSCEQEVGSGIEEYYLMRYVPARWFVRLGSALARAPAFPMRFALLVKPGRDPGPLKTSEELLACPKCRAPQPEWNSNVELRCDGCSFEGARRGQVLDLRYVPEGVRRWEAPA